MWFLQFAAYRYTAGFVAGAIGLVAGAVVFIVGCHIFGSVHNGQWCLLAAIVVFAVTYLRLCRLFNRNLDRAMREQATREEAERIWRA
jgi:intracellular septation protein A